MITQSTFGHTKAGETVTAYSLKNSRGASAVVLDYGCTIQSLLVPNAHGSFTDVVEGYDSFAEYENSGDYLGAAIGRVANRIGKAEFELNGKTYHLIKNDGENHLHGGLKGFDKFIWTASVEGEKLIFTRLSPDGEAHYPGNLSVRISYVLTEDCALCISYDAETDADTILNLTNHSYFKLGERPSVLDHSLQVFAEHFTECDEGCLPTGRILSVEGTPFDFRQPKTLGRDIGLDDEQLRRGRGYDHNFVLSDAATMKKAAVLESPDTGIRMTTCTTLPGIQVYSANSLTDRNGKGGRTIFRRGSICLETQMFPNGMAYAHFPSPVLRNGEHYHQETVYLFETI